MHREAKPIPTSQGWDMSYNDDNSTPKPDAEATASLKLHEGRYACSFTVSLLERPLCALQCWIMWSLPGDPFCKVWGGGKEV